LSANAYTIANLQTRLAVLADLDSGADGLVINAKWETGFNPTDSDGVYI